MRCGTSAAVGSIFDGASTHTHQFSAPYNSNSIRTTRTRTRNPKLMPCPINIPGRRRRQLTVDPTAAEPPTHPHKPNPTSCSTTRSHREETHIATQNRNVNNETHFYLRTCKPRGDMAHRHTHDRPKHRHRRLTRRDCGENGAYEKLSWGVVHGGGARI